MTTINEGLSERITKALNSQEQPTITLLSCLLAVQDELGYIPRQAISEIAEFNGGTINDVWGVASFYTNFTFDPPGDHTVELCWGTSCHVAGSTNIIKAVFEFLGLDGEGNTPDDALTVRYNTCLGACSQAPVIKVDDKLVGRLSPKRAIEVIKETTDKTYGKNGNVGQI